MAPEDSAPEQSAREGDTTHQADAESAGRTGFFRRWTENFLFGVRPGFGTGRRAIRLANAASARRAINWILPGSMGVFLLIAITAFSLNTISQLGMPYLSGRIILFDYLVFFFGWIGGWNMASRWRGRQNMIEDLVITSLRPPVIGNLLFAGSLGVWIRVLFVIALADTFLVSLGLPDNYSASFGRTDTGGQMIYLAITFPLVLIMNFVLAWFHLETLRIAYWMFATAALPRIDLRQKAIANLFLIIAYVTLLTGMGVAISGMIGLFGSAFLMIPATQAGANPNPFGVHLTWVVAAIIGLLIVGFFKRMITRMYEQAFTKSFLLFTWWGAGEQAHPMNYPPSLTSQLNRWIAYLRFEETQKAHGKPGTPPSAQEGPVYRSNPPAAAAPEHSAAPEPVYQPGEQRSGPPEEGQ